MRKILLSLVLLLAATSVCFAGIGQGGGKPGTANVTLTSGATEYAWAIPNGTTAISIQSRTAADFKMAAGATLSGTTYFTVKSGTVYHVDNTHAGFDKSLYFQSGNAGQIVEIMYWL